MESSPPSRHWLPPWTRHRSHDSCAASTTLPALGVAFVALVVWLTVRIINRREQWAKWTLAGTMIGVPILYVLGFGPICWLYHSDWFADDDIPFAIERHVYEPILWLDEEGPGPMRIAIDWYAHLWY